MLTPLRSQHRRRVESFVLDSTLPVQSAALAAAVLPGPLDRKWCRCGRPLPVLVADGAKAVFCPAVVRRDAEGRAWGQGAGEPEIRTETFSVACDCGRTVTIALG